MRYQTRPAPRPAIAATTPAAIVAPAYQSAAPIPSFMSAVAIATAKVESVVSPPQKPVARNRRSKGPDRDDAMGNSVSVTPMMKAPVTLATKIPKGKPTALPSWSSSQ